MMEATAVSASFLVMIFMLVGGVISLAATALWIWMLIDCASNEPVEGNDKLIWILIIVFTGGIGALVYLLARRPKRKALVGR